MATQWSLVDNQFPSFRGDESVKEQILALVNYMFVLVEQLKYNLSNLKSENWNTAALEAFSKESTDAAAAAAADQLIQVITQLERLQGTVSSLNGQVSEVPVIAAKVTALEELDSYHEAALAAQVQQLLALQEDVSALEAADGALRESLNTMDDQVGVLQTQADEAALERKALTERLDGEAGIAVQIAALTEQLNALTLILQQQENTLTLGGEGMEVRIVGTVYVNGELLGGAADETA